MLTFILWMLTIQDGPDPFGKLCECLGKLLDALLSGGIV